MGSHIEVIFARLVVKEKAANRHLQEMLELHTERKKPYKC
jgi:hypothetical protein